MTKTQNLAIKNKGRFLSFLLVSSALIKPVYGMQDWTDLFDPGQIHFNDEVRPKVYHYLDRRSLSKAARVSKRWGHLFSQEKEKTQLFSSELESTFSQKKRLFSLILDLTDGEPDEVQRAQDALQAFLGFTLKNEEEDDDLRLALQGLLDDIKQPEDLINEKDREELITSATLTQEHHGLDSLKETIEKIEYLYQNNPTLSPILYPLILFYRRYMERLLLTEGEGERKAHLQPKVIMSGEGLINLTSDEELKHWLWRKDFYQVSPSGITSYRITQQKARGLFSINEDGEQDKPNPDGTHWVTLWKGPQGGVVCKSLLGASNGLAVGMESTLYWLAKSLFDRGMAATSLLTFQGLEISSPLYSDPNQHTIQAADKIEGISLEKFITLCHQGQYQYDQLDLESFGEQIILSLLTNPTDGKPDNFFVTPDRNDPDKFHIVGIDNDMALGPSVDNKPQKSSEEAHIKVCNVLYCLPLMGKEIPASLQKKILDLNIDETLLKWLGFLRHQENEYNILESKGSITSHMKRELRLPLTLPENVLDFFEKRLNKIKEAIKGSSGQLTYQELFHEVDPLAEMFYKNTASIINDLRKLKGQPPLNEKSKLVNKIYQESINAKAPHKCSDIESYNPILAAYFHVHQNNHQGLKLAAVLEENLRRPIGMGELVWEAVENIVPQTAPKTKTIPVLVEEFLSRVDLHSNPHKKALFIDLGLSYFKDVLQATMDRTQENPEPSILHPSWKDPLLFLALLKEKAPEEMIDCLLEWGWEPGICDPETGEGIFHSEAIHTYSEKILRKLIDRASTTGRDFVHTHIPIQLLNAKDRAGRTPLDWAMDQKNSAPFLSLIQLGAQSCELERAVKLYLTLLETSEDSPLQKAFIQLMNSNAALKWKISWHHMVRSSFEEGGCSIRTGSFGELYLHPWVKVQIIDQEKKLIPYPLEPEKRLGNHLVGRAALLSEQEARRTGFHQSSQKSSFPLDTHYMFFKPYPELPGLEEAVGRLTRQILGFGAPCTELCNLCGVPVMVSQGIRGKNLLDVLKDEPELLKDLDLESTSGLILVAMLINPEDGKPDNYILEPHPTKPGKYRLVCVDNDHAFVPAVAREIPEDTNNKQKRLVVQVKTILYCLDQMKEQVPSAIKNLFRNIHPYTLLKEWLTPLQSLQDDYIKRLFKNKTDSKGFFETNDNCCLKISFPNTTIKNIFEKLLYMRDIFSADECKITHIELLEKLEYFLAKRYTPVLQKDIHVYHATRHLLTSG